MRRTTQFIVSVLSPWYPPASVFQLLPFMMSAYPAYSNPIFRRISAFGPSNFGIATLPM